MGTEYNPEEIEILFNNREYILYCSGFVTCINCYAIIDLRTDDNFNSTYSKYQCPNCDTWYNY